MKMKLLTALFTITLIAGVFFTVDTNASYSDEEDSNGNSFTTSSLDMSIRDTAGATVTSLFSMTGIKPGDSQEKTIVIAKDGTEDFTYRLKIDSLGGTPALCDAINLDVKHGIIPVYSGKLSGFTGDPATFSAGSNAWTFTARLGSDDTALMHSECTFALRADAWQNGSGGLWGLSDKESLTNTIATNTWVVVSFGQNTETHTASFKVENIEDYTSLEYKITYTSDGGDKGIQGTHSLSHQPSFEKTDQFMGSCTSGGTCTPDSGVSNIKLTIDLTDTGGTAHHFEKSL